MNGLEPNIRIKNLHFNRLNIYICIFYNSSTGIRAPNL